MKGYHDSKTPLESRDLWQTPRFVFDNYYKQYNYGLDLAASDLNHLTDCYITEEMNAFNISMVNDFMVFNGIENRNIWCNPPYSNSEKWVDLCIELSKKLNVKVTLLLPADTSVKWFKKAWDNASTIEFINGRISFVSSLTGKPVAGNNKGSVIFTFGEDHRIIDLIDRDSLTTPS